MQIEAPLIPTAWMVSEDREGEEIEELPFRNRSSAIASPLDLLISISY